MFDFLINPKVGEVWRLKSVSQFSDRGTSKVLEVKRGWVRFSFRDNKSNKEGVLERDISTFKLLFRKEN